MNNTQYIKKLRAKLSVLDKKSRNDIIREIESQMTDSDEPLLERFGPPESLAASYLEGIDIRTSIHKKVFGLGKIFITIIGLTVFLLVVIGLFLYWHFKGDQFDYSDTEAAELTTTEDW